MGSEKNETVTGVPNYSNAIRFNLYLYANCSVGLVRAVNQSRFWAIINRLGSEEGLKLIASVLYLLLWPLTLNCVDNTEFRFVLLSTSKTLLSMDPLGNENDTTASKCLPLGC